MPEKIVHLKHQVCDYSCMWNGIEDIYMTKTGEEIPQFFFFCLSGVGNIAYLKRKDEWLPRQLIFGDGRPKKIYGNISEIAGFTFKFAEGRTFPNALKGIKEQIDVGKPVVLGPLDMFHLPYLKFYHKFHIPIHYILMVGYNDETQSIYVLDCGKEEMQTLPLEDLRMAWEIEKSSVGGANEFVKIEFADSLKSTREIAELALRKKAKEMLEPQVSFVGVKGLRKAAKELPGWESELSPQGYKNSLMNILEFLGTVPKLPNIVMGFDAPEDEGMLYQACREKMGNMLKTLGETYHSRNWKDAAELFFKSGKCFEEVAGHLIRFLNKGENQLEEIPLLFEKIADLETAAYQLLL
ncbi:MAG: BtrH N-terminal domain-containing protein [Ruminiclostridium sp.]|nr:BtrH N-terminal domain-containing protein [Ruminiclostridium sp.]